VSTRARVVVGGAGACTPLGMSAEASAAAVRAGISGFGSHPFMVDTAGNRAVVAAAPYVNEDLVGTGRLSELAWPAVAEALEPLACAPGAKPAIPIFLGLPPPRPGRPDRLDALLARITDEVHAWQLRPADIVRSEIGHAAGTMALHAAWEAIRNGSTELALVGGVDSYLEPETLEWLEAHEQLHSAGLDNNPYGFVPGEAAAFVLLASDWAMRHYQLRPALDLCTVATTRESNLIKTDAVCTGEGLTALFRSLAQDVPAGVQIDMLYGDMNGEPYRADEFGFATVREGTIFKDPSEFMAPADCWGDVGAASGPLYMILCDAAARRSYAAGPLSAAFTSSETGERSGFLTAPSNMRQTPC